MSHGSCVSWSHFSVWEQHGQWLSCMLTSYCFHLSGLRPPGSTSHVISANPSSWAININKSSVYQLEDDLNPIRQKDEHPPKVQAFLFWRLNSWKRRSVSIRRVRNEDSPCPHQARLKKLQLAHCRYFQVPSVCHHWKQIVSVCV